MERLEWPRRRHKPAGFARCKTDVVQASSVSSVLFVSTPPNTGTKVYKDEFLWENDQKFSARGIRVATAHLLSDGCGNCWL